MDRFTLAAGFLLRKQNVSLRKIRVLQNVFHRASTLRNLIACKQIWTPFPKARFPSTAPHSRHEKTNLSMAVCELTQKIPLRPAGLIAQCVQMCPGPENKHLDVNLSVGCVRDAEKKVLPAASGDY